MNRKKLYCSLPPITFVHSQLTFACSKSTIETLERGKNMLKVNNKRPERRH